MNATRDAIDPVRITDHNGHRFLDESVLELCVDDAADEPRVRSGAFSESSSSSSDGRRRRTELAPVSAGLWVVSFANGDGAQKISLRRECDGAYLAGSDLGVHSAVVFNTAAFWWTVLRGGSVNSFRLCNDEDGHFLRALSPGNNGQGMVSILDISLCMISLSSNSPGGSSQRSPATSWIFHTSAKHASQTRGMDISDRGRSTSIAASNTPISPLEGSKGLSPQTLGNSSSSSSSSVLARGQRSRSTSPTLVADEDDEARLIIERIEPVELSKAVGVSGAGPDFASTATRAATRVDDKSAKLKHDSGLTSSNATLLPQSCPPIIRPPARLPPQVLPARDVPPQDVPPQDAVQRFLAWDAILLARFEAGKRTMRRK